jgi:hypothetical protein
VAESKNVYVKIGERGRLIERTAATPKDHVNLKATGWVLKGSKNAPTEKDATAEPRVTSGLTDAVPTSQRAQADPADSTTTTSRTGTTTKGATSSAVGAAGAVADSKSQAAAGK